MTPRKVDPTFLSDNGKLYTDREIAHIKKTIQSEVPGKDNYYVPRTKIKFTNDLDGPFSVTRIEGQYYAIYPGKKNGSHLGEGAFGKTKLAQNLDTGEWVVIKIMRNRDEHEARLSKIAGLGLSSLYSRESHKDKSIKKHEFVISLAHGEEMLNFLVDDTIPFNERMQAAKELVKQYSELHQKGILHMDAKLENAFYDNNTKTVTILDYGLSQRMNANGQYIGTHCGTPTYIPSEIRPGRNTNVFSEKTEAFSIGVMMAETLGFELELANGTEDKLWAEYKPVLPPDASNQQQRELATLINLMINTNPVMRPSLDAVTKELNRIETRPIPPYINHLLSAIQSNDRQQIQQALIIATTHKGFNINNPVDIRGNLLHIAAMQGRDVAVEALLEKGANVNAQGLNDHTPLHLAAATPSVNSQKAATALLADADIEVDIKNKDGDTALHVAARIGNILVAKQIIKEIPDLGLKNNLQQTAYDLAKAGNTPGHVHLPELVKPIGFFEQLSKTLGLGKTEPASPAMPPGATTNHGIQSSTQAVQQKLLQKEALTEALHKAIREGDLYKTKQCCRQGADVNHLINGQAALHVAARCDAATFNREIIEYLRTRADINLPDAHGSTLLHIAAEFNDTVLVQALIEDPKINMNCQDVNGDTPLHIANLCGYVEMGEMLMRHHDTAIDIKNIYGLDAVEISESQQAMKNEALPEREKASLFTIEHEAVISDDSSLSLESSNRASIKVGGK